MMECDNLRASVRYVVEPRLVPPRKAARRLHLTLSKFKAHLPALQRDGFPSACNITGHFDLKAIDAWLDGKIGRGSEKASVDPPLSLPKPPRVVNAKGMPKHYAVRKGRGYWLVTPRMREAGFENIKCGPDGPGAWAIAKQWEERWQTARAGQDYYARRVYPKDSIGDAFERFRQTSEWAKKPPRTREDWERGWKYIEPWAAAHPRDVTFEFLDLWYDRLCKTKGIGEAGRAMKIWRALYKIMASMKLCPQGEDPSLAIRKTAVPGRTQTWKEGEVVRLVKHAWRRGYCGLACIIAVAWDTSFAPVDARTLTPAQAVDADGDWGFAIKRGKTGEDAFGFLTRRTRRLVEAYIKSLNCALRDDAPIFRTKGYASSSKVGGRPRLPAPYTKNSLVDDFADMRREVFGKEEKRRLMDMRRTGAVEANAGGASVEFLAAKMGNSIDQNKTLQKTYIPHNLVAIRAADAARLEGRRQLSSIQCIPHSLTAWRSPDDEIQTDP